MAAACIRQTRHSPIVTAAATKHGRIAAIGIPPPHFGVNSWNLLRITITDGEMTGEYFYITMHDLVEFLIRHREISIMPVRPSDDSCQLKIWEDNTQIYMCEYADPTDFARPVCFGCTGAQFAVQPQRLLRNVHEASARSHAAIFEIVNPPTVHDMIQFIDAHFPLQWVNEILETAWLQNCKGCYATDEAAIAAVKIASKCTYIIPPEQSEIEKLRLINGTDAKMREIVYRIRHPPIGGHIGRICNVIARTFKFTDTYY